MCIPACHSHTHSLPPSHVRPAVLSVLHKACPRKQLVRLLGAPAVCGQDGGMSLCKGHAGAAAASAASSSCASVCAPAAAPSAGGQATARLGLCWPGSSCCQYACTGKESAPAAVWVGVHRQAPRIHGMQQRREDGPGCTQLVPAQLYRRAGQQALAQREGGQLLSCGSSRDSRAPSSQDKQCLHTMPAWPRAHTAQRSLLCGGANACLLAHKVQMPAYLRTSADACLPTCARSAAGRRGWRPG